MRHLFSTWVAAMLWVTFALLVLGILAGLATELNGAP